VEAMPKKKTPVRNPWTKEDLRQLKAHSKARTTAVEVAKAMKPTRGGGPAKGEDDRRRSWSSPRSARAEIDFSHGDRT
jgi:hypothetical protein